MKALFLRLLFCVCIAGLTLYGYIEKLNQLTSLRLRIPVLNRELKAILEENKQLQFEIDQFENPSHLMELARKPEFSHLKSPYLKDIVVLPTVKESVPNETVSAKK